MNKILLLVCAVCLSLAIHYSKTSGQDAVPNTRVLVAADLNGTWQFESRSELTSKSIIRVSTIVDLDRLSLWLVNAYDDAKTLEVHEFTLTNVQEGVVEFQRTEIVKQRFMRHSGSKDDPEKGRKERFYDSFIRRYTLDREVYHLNFDLIDYFSNSMNDGKGLEMQGKTIHSLRFSVKDRTIQLLTQRPNFLCTYPPLFPNLSEEEINKQAAIEKLTTEWKSEREALKEELISEVEDFKKEVEELKKKTEELNKEDRKVYSKELSRKKFELDQKHENRLSKLDDGYLNKTTGLKKKLEDTIRTELSEQFVKELRLWAKENEVTPQSSTLRKFINSVPENALEKAASKRKEIVGYRANQPRAVDRRQGAAEFVSALQPLADGALEEFGRKFSNPEQIRLEEMGMAIAFALLKLSDSK